MFENETLVTEEVAENVEHTTEETPKTYTEAEFNAKLDEVLGKKIARREAKIRKEYERKYGDLENVLRAGTGKNSVDEMTDTFTKFYESKGVKINKNPDYSEQDIETLATADANEFIGYGDDEAAEEFDRLEALGANMTARERATFRKLAEHLQSKQTSRELAEIGVTEDEYNSREFQDFAKKFTKDTPIRDVYDIYTKTKPKKEIRTMGSMKNSVSDDGTVKEFYTRDEALQFTKSDFDKNPALYNAVVASMRKW